MAAQQKKNRKFDRHSKRSAAAAAYRSGNRSLTNKLRKIRKHLKAHPSDNVAIIAAKSGTGPKVDYKVKTATPPLERITHEHLVDKNFKKAHRLYMVFSEGVLVDITPHYKEAKSSYDKLNSNGALCSRVGSLITILTSKRATPIVKSSYKLREWAEKAI